MTSSRAVDDRQAARDDASARQPQLGLAGQLATLARALAGVPERRGLAWLFVAVLVVLVLTAAAQVGLNSWNSPFYNAISARDTGLFRHELVVFFELAGALLVLNVVQMWLNLTMQMKLRAGLMRDLLDEWLQPLSAFRLAHCGIVGVNPDQRLHEDTRHLSELSTTLAIGLLQAAILLCVFIVVLWQLSAGFAFGIFGLSISIPGYMVWAAILYALIGSVASFRTGRSLIHLNAARYNREAELRAALVRVSDDIATIALLRGEDSERRLLDEDVRHVLGAMREIVTATTRLTWVTAGYGWMTQVVPILVAAPVYFAGHISFGELMMAVGAFNQVQSSLRWFVDNFSAIADWRATLLRVADFRVAVEAVADLRDDAGRIDVEHGEPGCLRLESVVVAAQEGNIRLEEDRITVKCGERLQIIGDSGDAQTVFFRALAGLWPWGDGRIRLPADESFMHLAHRPYVRAGRLRDVIAYPTDPRRFADAQFVAALEAVGLGGFASRLDEAARWDHDLGEQDLQRLAFARLALQAPAWIVIDQALETLDDDTHGQVLAMLQTTLKGATVINFGRPEAPGLFPRSIALLEEAAGSRSGDVPA